MSPLCIPRGSVIVVFATHTGLSEKKPSEEIVSYFHSDAAMPTRIDEYNIRRYGLKQPLNLTITKYFYRSLYGLKQYTRSIPKREL